MTVVVADSPAVYRTVGEIAAELRVHKMTVYRMIHSGELGAIKVGRSYRVPVEAWQEWLRAEASQ